MASEHSPDIILITETWCHSDISDAFLSLDGYELISELRCDREDTAMGRGGGLLVVYVKTGLTVFKLDKPLIFHQYCSFKIFDVNIFLIYRSPSAPPAAMDGLIELVKTAPKNSIFIGDFNLPEVNWSEAAAGGRTQGLRQAMEEKYMEQLVNTPTQVRGNILDLVITDIPDRIADITVTDGLGTSDHSAIFSTIIIENRVKNNKPVLNWRKADFAGMHLELKAEPWNELHRSETTEGKWAAFKGRLHAAVNKFVPVKPAGPLGRPPWMSRDIAAALRRKKRLWRQVGRSEEYKEVNRAVKNLIRKNKRAFEKRLAASGQDRKKEFYAYVKKKTKSRSSVGPLIDGNKNKITDDKEMANLLNSFFSSVFTKNDGQAAPQVGRTSGPIINDVTVTPDMIKKRIEKLRPSSAAGPDNIGPQLLQELKDIVAAPLAEIFNSSLREGVVPEDWRQANVTPIFKKGARTDPGNYRPVSLTSVCCKLLEGVIKDNIMDHLNNNDLINNSQHGFVPRRSCATNLLEFFEIATKSVDDGDPFDIVFLDFAKAFDKVPLAPLLAKLEGLGVSGQLLEWIRAWLTDRKQRVVLNGKASTWTEVCSGVPQGSILGPLLFVVYINDIDTATQMIEALRKFADDTKLGQRVATAEQRERLQAALDALIAWATKWGMQFNIKKCKVMHLGHANPKHVYTMNGEALESTDEERDVGVTITSSLKPSAQCAKAAKTANSVLGQLTRAFHYRDRNIFVRLYKQYVQPHLEFSVAAWSPWLEADKEILEKVQRRAIKMVAGLTSTTYEGRLKELGMVTLEERRHQADMTQVFRIVHGYDNVNAAQWFTGLNSERVTRRAADPLNLAQGRSRLDLRRNFFSQRVIAGWNAVPPELKRARTVLAFKRG